LSNKPLRRQVLKAGVGFIAGTGSAILFDNFTAVLAQFVPGTVIITDKQPLKFPRQQDWESKMCAALGMKGIAPTYAGLTPFQKAIGTMGLNAAEVYFPTIKQPNIGPFEVIAKMQPLLDPSRDPLAFFSVDTALVNAITGLVVAQIISKLKLNQSDAESIVLREWAIPVFRQMQVDTAVGTLKEYYKWKNNPCQYSTPGYQRPQKCFAVIGNNPYNSMWQIEKPPSDLLLKAGLAYAAGNNDQIVKGVSAGIGAVGLVGAFLATATGLGVQTGFIAAGVALTTTLFNAFGGGSISAASAAASAAIGTTSWAGVVAGPAAIISASIMIGVTQGVALFESEQVEFKLKQAIAAAMKENINMANVVADERLASGLFIGAVKSATSGWNAPDLAIDGQVTFFCEAGYVAKFYLNYTLNGQQKSFNTGNMTAGFWQQFDIPAAAKNIEVKGVMLLAGEKQIFKETLQRPTYTTYKVYGTIFQPAWSNDWPRSVSGEISSTAGELKFNHGAGFVAKWQVTYNLPDKPNQSINSGNTSLGWKKTYNIPLTATNVRVLVQGATGLAWEPWRTTYDKTFPSAPNLCLKIYGTTLNQKWNSDCV
jgi:hypothetical protein